MACGEDPGYRKRDAPGPLPALCADSRKHTTDAQVLGLRPGNEFLRNVGGDGSPLRPSKAILFDGVSMQNLEEGPLLSPGAALAPYVAEPRMIADVVLRLREIDRRTSLERAIAIGRVVLDRFFGGSPEVWRERRNNKNNSIRRIAEHPDCPLSRSALNEAVGVYVAVQSLPCVQTSGHITASHVAAITFLGAEQQCRWLERAEQGSWSVRQLKEHVRADRHEAGERRGRPRAARSRRLVSGLRIAVTRLRRAARELAGLDLGPDEERELAGLADEIATVQAEIRSQKRPGHSDSYVGPRALVKVNPSEGDRGRARHRATGGL